MPENTPPGEVEFDPAGEPTDTDAPDFSGGGDDRRGLILEDHVLALDPDEDDGDPEGQPSATPKPEGDDDPDPEDGDGDDEEGEGEKPKGESEPTIEIDGEKYTLEELREMRSKSTDYTKKTMDLAEQRKALEPVVQLQNYLNELPQDAQEELFAFARQIDEQVKQGIPVRQAAGQAPAPAPDPVSIQLDGIKEDELSDEGVALLKLTRSIAAARAQDQATIQQLRANIQELAGVLPEVKGYIQDAQVDKEATLTAAQIKKEWSVEVTPQELRQWAKDTGISDLEAAFLKVNKQALAAGTFKKGHQEGSREKPRAPGRQAGRVVDTSKMSADQIMRAAARGAKFADD